MRRRAALIAVIALAGFTSVSGHAQKQQQKLYRWVDNAGVVHYGDSVPPEYADKDRDVLNKQGVAVGFEEGEVTPEEQAEKDRKAAAEEAERQAKVDAARRDQVLLDTYLSVSEIEALRDRRLELLESQIKVTEQYLANLHKRLGALQDEAKLYKPESTNPDAPELPDNLKLDISRTTASISLYEQTLAVTRHEQEQLKTEFAADIDRFKQLKGI
jgi:Domain of unknown function (DUF4124)